MPNEELKLEPCPFCGGEAELMNISGYFKQGLSSVGWFVKCRKGCVEQNPYSSDHDAVEAWNNRAKEANKDPKLERCPFCGGDDLYIVNANGYRDTTVGVFCNWCKVTLVAEENDEEGDTPDTRRRAIIAWNRRENNAD